MGDGVELATAYIALVPSLQDRALLSQLNGAGSRAGSSAGALAGKTFGVRFRSSLREPLAGIAKVVAGAFAVEKLAEFGKELVSVGDEYTSQLAKIKALSTESDLAQVGGINGVARALAANKNQYAKYGSTLSDAAAGVTALVKAGQTLPAALKEVNATMQLAKSGMLDVDTASEIVSNAMNTFHLRATDAAKVGNEFANAADASAADVSTLADGLKYVGPVAKASNVGLNQTLAILAELSNAGIDASNSGTGFRKFLSSLQAPTGAAAATLKDLGVQVFTASGKAKPLSTMIADLDKAMSGLSDKEKKADLRNLFGLTGIASAGVILDNGAKGLAKYTKAVDRAGGSSRLAEANSAGLAGTFRMIKADATSTAQDLYQRYSPTVDKALRGAFAYLQQEGPEIKDWAKNAFSTWGPAIKDTAHLVGDLWKSVAPSGGGGGALAKFGTLIKTSGKVIDELAKALDAIPQPVKRFGVEAGIAAVALSGLNKGVRAFTGSSLVGGVTRSTRSLATLRSDLVLTRAAMGQMGPVTEQTAQAQARMAARTDALRSAAKQAAGIGGILLLSNSLTKTASGMGTLESAIGGAATGFAVGGPWGAAIGGAAGLVTGLWRQLDKASSSAQALRVQTASDIKVKVDQSAVDSLITALEKAHGDYSLLSEDAKGQALGTAASNPKTGFSTGAVTSKTGLSTKTQADIFAGDPSATRVGEQRLAALKKELNDFADAQSKASDVKGWAEWSVNMQSYGTNAAADFAKWGTAVQNAYTSGSIGAQQFATLMGQVNSAESDGIETSQERDQAIRAAGSLYDAAGQKSKAYADAAKGLKTELANGGATLSGYNHQIAAVAKALGMTKAQFDKIPARVKWKVEADGVPQTTNQAKKVLNDLGKFATYRQIKSVLSLVGVNASRKQITDLQHKYGNTQKVVSTLIKLDGVGSAIGQVHTLAGAIDALHDKTITVTQLHKIIDVHTDPLHGGGTHSALGGTVPLGGPYRDRYPYLLAPGERITPDNRGQVRKSRKILDMIAAGALTDKTVGLSTGGTIGAAGTAMRVAIPQVVRVRSSARSAVVAPATVDLSGASMTVVLDDGTELRGYVSDIADSRVVAAASMTSMLGRTGR